MRAGIAQGGFISSVLFSLYVNDMPSYSRHDVLALYAEDTFHIATYRQPALFVKYLQTYLSRLEQWLNEWWIGINVSKSSAMPFAKTGRRIPKPRSVQLFGEPFQWVDDSRFLGMTLDRRLNWSKLTDQVRKRAAQRLGRWDLSYRGEAASPSRMVFCCISSSSVL
jgi:hypothetical protein